MVEETKIYKECTHQNGYMYKRKFCSYISLQIFNKISITAKYSRYSIIMIDYLAVNEISISAKYSLCISY